MECAWPQTLGEPQDSEVTRQSKIPEAGAQRWRDSFRNGMREFRELRHVTSLETAVACVHRE